MSYQQPRSTSYVRSQISGRRSSGIGSCSLWFSVGCIFGLIGGILAVIAVATFAATPILPFQQSPVTGDSDIVVSVDEEYLNSVVASRVNGSYPTGLDGLTLTNLQLDLAPGNRMDLVSTFHVSAGFLDFNVNARINNRLSVDDAGLTLSMIGDPQIGDLNISLDFLPFDLKGTIRQALDNVNNNLLLAEINGAAQPSLESTNFAMDSVSTDDGALTVRLKERR